MSNLVGGTATVATAPNNTVTYTPTAGFSGAGGFTYTISDGTTPRSAQVSVTVTPPGNNPPVAVNDTATTAAGTAVNIAVLANDSDPENNPLTVTARVELRERHRNDHTATTRSPIPPPRASAVLAALPTRSPTERRRDPRKSA